jgi:hypothetical protein
VKIIWQPLKDIIVAWNEDKAQRLAAALAFYTMFTLSRRRVHQGLCAALRLADRADRDRSTCLRAGARSARFTFKEFFGTQPLQTIL